MTGDRDIQDVLVSPVRRRIVSELSAPSEQATRSSVFADRRSLTAMELANLLDLHVSTMRFHLDQLVAAGVLQSATERRGVGRPRMVYAVVDSFDSMIDTNNTRPLTLLAELLVTEVAVGDSDTRHSPEQLGERWAQENVLPTSDAPAHTPGQWIAKAGAVTDVMLGWGFEASLSTTKEPGTTRLDLHHCPFRELAQINQDVVCGIHRGIIAGTLRQIGETEADVDLEPFAQGTTCIALLQTDLSTQKQPHLAEEHIA